MGPEIPNALSTDAHLTRRLEFQMYIVSSKAKIEDVPVLFKLGIIAAAVAAEKTTSEKDPVSTASDIITMGFLFRIAILSLSIATIIFLFIGWDAPAVAFGSALLILCAIRAVDSTKNNYHFHEHLSNLFSTLESNGADLFLIRHERDLLEAIHNALVKLASSILLLHAQDPGTETSKKAELEKLFDRAKAWDLTKHSTYRPYFDEAYALFVKVVEFNKERLGSKT